MAGALLGPFCPALLGATLHARHMAFSISAHPQVGLGRGPTHPVPRSSSCGSPTGGGPGSIRPMAVAPSPTLAEGKTLSLLPQKESVKAAPF